MGSNEAGDGTAKPQRGGAASSAAGTPYDAGFGDLSPLLAPRSVAVIGASDRAGNLGGVAVGYLRKFGFRGSIWPVNPNRAEVGGFRCYPGLRDLPGIPDLAILALPATAISAVVRECVEAGVPAALAWAGGFAETGPEGRRLQDELEQVCRDGGIKFCGPNCLGIMNTSIGLIASFGSMLTEVESLDAGSISMVSQSGGISGIAATLAQQAGFGFRVTVSCGNEVVLTLSDFVRAIASDEGTRVIALYAEGISDPDNFISALTEVRRRGKTVVILKGGASEASGRAALAHTGRLAGSDRAFSAVLRELGAIRVHSVEELVDVCAYLSTLGPGQLPKGRAVVMTTFGGGSGVLNADQCVSSGLTVPQLAPETRERLAGLLTPLASVGNPVDLTPQSINDPQWRPLLPEALASIVDDPNVDSVLFMSGGMGHRSAELTEIVHGLRAHTQKPVCLSWMAPPTQVIGDLAASGIFTFSEHARAARTIAHLAVHAETLRLRTRKIAEATEPFPWETHLATQKGVVSEDAVSAILEAAGLPVAAGRLVRQADGAAEAAEQLGFPVAMKCISPQITHRAAEGFVALNVASPEIARQTDARFRAQASARGLAYEGTWIQKMFEGHRELLVTALRDRDFGVMIGCGIGGNLTEIVDDVVFARAPIDAPGAFDLLGTLRTTRKHPEFIDETSRRRAAAFIARFSSLVASAPWERFNLEINPLKIGRDGLAAVDALLVIE